MLMVLHIPHTMNLPGAARSVGHPIDERAVSSARQPMRSRNSPYHRCQPVLPVWTCPRYSAGRAAAESDRDAPVPEIENGTPTGIALMVSSMSYRNSPG